MDDTFTTSDWLSTDSVTLSTGERTRHIAAVLATAIVRLHTRGVHRPTSAADSAVFADRFEKPARVPLPLQCMPTSMAALAVNEPSDEAERDQGA